MAHPTVATDQAEARWTTWDRFVEATPGAGFMQTSWWAEFRSGAGFRNFGAVIRGGGHLLGGGIVHRFETGDGTGFYYLPEGPVVPDDEEDAAGVFEALLDDIQRQRAEDPLVISHLRLEPRWEAIPGYLRAFGPVPAIADGYEEPRETLCVDLRVPETAILAQMHPKGRYNIALARRHGVTVTEDATPRGIADFLALYRAMVARKGIEGKPDDYFTELLQHLQAHRCGTLYFAEREGERLASAITIQFGARATYFFGASHAAGREHMAPYLLQFEMMRRAKARHCAWYDLWGIAPEGAADHPWAAISEFKLKFGGRRVSLVPTLDLVFDPAAYEAHRRRALG